MTGFRTIGHDEFLQDMEEFSVSTAADKAAALSVVRASVYLALCSADPEEICATFDAAMQAAA
jgi:hypothetical protein